jgi:hypothetical protein
MVWIQSGDLLMVWIQISLKFCTGEFESWATQWVCLVGFSRQPGCVSQDHWSLALEMRPICSYLVSLAQGALRIMRAWI